MTKPGAPATFTDPDILAGAIIRETGKDIVLALPLGLGKANHVANALFARAAKDRSIRLNIFTALTLEPPRTGGEIEKRFLGPLSDRLFKGYPELLYAKALRDGTLPDNVEVNEFFLLAGRWLNVPKMQRHYIAANYTQALNYVLERGANVVAQLVAKSGARYSIASNTDMTLDMLAARKAGKADFILVGQVNSELPFMGHDAALPASSFTTFSKAAKRISRFTRRPRSRWISPTTRSACMWLISFPMAARSRSASVRWAMPSRTRSFCGTRATRNSARRSKP